MDPPARGRVPNVPYNPLPKASRHMTSKRNYTPGKHLTQQLPQTAPSTTQPAHTDTQSTPETAQQHDEPPSKRTRSHCPSSFSLVWITKASSLACLLNL